MMDQKKSILVSLLSITLMFCFSCNAPRNNPLDPISNENPYILSKEFYSIVTNQRLLPPQTYEIAIRIKIKDENQVIDSVFVENEYLKLKSNLFFDNNEKVYYQKIKVFDRGIFEDIVGHEFSIKAKDFSSKKFELGNEIVKRIIIDELKVKSPLNGESVESLPLLSWEKFGGKFSFTYTVQVFTDDFSRDLVWEKNNIPADSTSIEVDTQLPIGEYFWMVWGVDQFLNRTSSKPATFKIN